MSYKKVIIIGSGNVAFHLCQRITQVKSTFTIVQCFGRNKKALEKINQSFKIDITTDWNELKEADIYIVSISDDAIKPLVKELINHTPDKAIIAHTSGSRSLDEIADWKHKGVFYPLQTFNQSISLDWSNTPIFIEATDDADNKTLEELASSMGSKFYLANSQARAKLHIAAVFACNFTTFMYSEAQKLLQKDNISFDVLKPLIEQTTKKVIDSNSDINIFDIMTGPAKRGDKETIKKQIKELTYNKRELKIYKTLTKEILDIKNEEL